MNNRFFLSAIIAATLFVFHLAATNALAKTDTTPVHAPPAEPSPYPIYDSGTWADPISDPHIYWIDNDRVLFRTVKGNDKTRISSGPFNLSIWEIGKGVKAYTGYHASVTACIREGMIHRTQKDSQGKVQRFYGKFGEEKEFEFPKTKGAFFDDMNCRVNDNAEIVSKRQSGRRIRPLLNRHGYLDLGPQNKPSRLHKEPRKLFRSGDNKALEISIPPSDIDRILYYEFKDAYMVYSYEAGKRFWWLYPDSKLEEVRTSFGMAYPTLSGFVAGRGKPKSDYDPGTVGLYFWSDKQHIKLISGYVHSVAVSPDGCKLAFVHYPYFMGTSIKDPAPITLKAINLCVEEKTNGK